MNRRDFIKSTLLAGAALTVGLPEGLHAKTSKDLRWVFLLDTTKCVGCGFCVRACKLENEIPYDSSVTRTWVERYIKKLDGEVIIDTPRGGRDGYISNDPRGLVVTEKDIAKAMFVPKLCNQCDNPPCVQVCPVGATYQTPDGVVLVDRTWCIGCGYCIMSCPYGVRFFHPIYKVAEKCNWCYHRISKGMKTACVDACAFGARQIGNFRDPEDPVTKTILTQRVNVLKDEYGTKPMAYYIGLDDMVR